MRSASPKALPKRLGQAAAFHRLGIQCTTIETYARILQSQSFLLFRETLTPQQAFKHLSSLTPNLQRQLGLSLRLLGFNRKGIVRKGNMGAVIEFCRTHSLRLSSTRIKPTSAQLQEYIAALEAKFFTFNPDRLAPITDKILGASSTKHPYLVGVGGSSGANKSTLAHFLGIALEDRGKKVLVLTLDDFVKSPEERATLDGEFDEHHYNFTAAADMLKAIQSGTRSIEKPIYNRSAKTMGSEKIDLSDIDIVIIDGLYPVTGEDRLNNLVQYFDLPIYVTAKQSDMRAWRFQQEKERQAPRTEAQLAVHWDQGMVPEWKKNIAPSRANAHFIVFMGSDHSPLIFEPGALLSTVSVPGPSRVGNDSSFSRIQVNLQARLSLGLPDKARMLPPAGEGPIIELGCAYGDIIGLGSILFPGRLCVGIDIADKMLAEARANYPHAVFYRRDLTSWQLPDEFYGNFGTVLISSALHEVFIEHGLEAAARVLKLAFDLLGPNGNLILRDGVKPAPEEMVTVMFKTTYAKTKFERFVTEYKQRQITFTYTDPSHSTIKLSAYDLHDMLCKYYFEGSMWEKDMREAFGLITAAAYRALLSQAGFEISSSESYIAPYLLPLWERDFRMLQGSFPDSHMLAVAKKVA